MLNWSKYNFAKLYISEMAIPPTMFSGRSTRYLSALYDVAHSHHVTDPIKCIS